jgi:hypothetical protein
MNLTSQTIRTCLKNLKKWKNLTIRSTNRFSILKVTNWETYQETENSINQQTNQELTSNQPATNQPTNHKTRSKEVKNVKKKETTYSEDFEKFWSAYPKRIGKPKAWESWNRHNGNRPTIETIVLKIDDLKKTRQWQKDDGDFIPLPTTWLNRCGWDDECKVEIKSNKPKGFSMEELHAIADAGRKPRGL